MPMRALDNATIELYCGDMRAGKFPRVGNMFSAAKLRDDLARVREDIAFAVLLGHGRRTLAEGQPVPCLKSLRKLETELIVRLDMLGGGA